MKKKLTLASSTFYLILFCLLTALSSCDFSKNKISSEEVSFENPKESQHSKEEKKESKLQNIEDRNLQEFLKTQDPALGRIPRERLKDARKFMNDKFQNLAETAIPIDWEERGPDDVGGRTRALLIDANDGTHKTVWAGAVSGGLWKTTDITATSPNWTKVDDLFDNLAVSSIAQDPSTPNTMYFGTGEGWFNFDAVRGEGIWKTTNGGTTWTQLASTDNTTFWYVQKVLVDNSGNVYACTRDGGVQKSTDGGTSWTQVLADGVGATSDRAADIELAADNDLYVSFGIFSTGEVYKSDFATHGANTGNAGNWTSAALPTTHRRIDLTCAPSNSDYVYAVTHSTSSNSIDQVYQSTDGGGTWTAKTVPSNAGSQAWYDLIVEVDPNSATTIFVGGVGIARSTDGGTNWTTISGIHSDHHNVVFQPGSSTTAVFGNDGGVYYSTTLTTTQTIIDKNKNYNVTQYYACAIDPGVGVNFFLGGTQDNGSHYLNSAGIGSYNYVAGGDGAFCHIDQDNSDIQMTSYQNNDHRVTSNAWASATSVNFPTTAHFINPTDYDSDANVLYGAYKDQYYCLIKGVGTTNTKDSLTHASFPTEEITALTVSPITSNRVFMAFYNDDIYRVDNANTAPSVTALSFPMPTNGYVSSIALEDGNESHMLVTLSNYGITSIYETTNGGTSWTAVEGNLPDMPVRWGMFSPTNSDHAIIATELGVWSTDNLNGGSTDWDPSNTNLANVRTDMLQTRTSDDVVIVATHGRGIYSTDYFSGIEVNFSATTSTSSESSATGTSGCTGYEDINIPVTITVSPGSNVGVTCSVTGGTATSGDDFSLQTTSLTFVPAGATTQNIVVRVFDDAAIEGMTDETVILTIDAGANNGVNLTHTLSLTDNDEEPSTGTATNYLMNEDFEAGGTLGSISWASLDFGGDMDVNDFFLGSNGLMSGTYSAYVSDDGSTLNYDKNDTTAILLRSAQMNATGITGLTANFDFKSDGEAGNDFGILYYSLNGSNFSYLAGSTGSGPFGSQASSTAYSVALPAAVEGNTFYLGWGWFNDNDGVGNNPPFTIDNVQVSYQGPVNAETTLSTSVTEEVGPNQEVVFVDTDEKVLAKIKNNSAHDWGCVTVLVDGAGTGTTSWLGYEITDKTYLVTPTTNNASASYDITFYYDATEVPGWGTVNMAKSTGAMSSSNAGNSTVGAGTSATFGSVTSYTATFTGMSGFAGTNAPVGALPVQLTSFIGQPVEDKIQLDWITATEQNNDYFLLEKSTDGENYDFLAEVDGAGNSDVTNKYRFMDRNPFPGVNYYRLTQFDFDGKKEVVGIEAVEYRKEVVSATIQPNPVFGEKLRLKYITSFEENVQVEILDMSGKIFLNERVPIDFGENDLVFPVGNISNGIYFLRTTQGENVRTIRFLKTE